MSLRFYLCRAPEGSGPLTTWETNHAGPLGSIGEVKARISALHPDITWSPSSAAAFEYWSGLGRNRPEQPYLDLSISTATIDAVDADAANDQVYFVVGRKMPPSIMRGLMEALDLNHVSCPDTGDLVDPYAYTDQDAYFAKKAWVRS